MVHHHPLHLRISFLDMFIFGKDLPSTHNFENFSPLSSTSPYKIRFRTSDFRNKISKNMKSDFRNIFSEIRFQTSLLEMSLANRFKNFYRGQLFNFCLRFFSLKISLLEMLIAFGNEHLKRKKTKKKQKDKKGMLFIQLMSHYTTPVST